MVRSLIRLAGAACALVLAFTSTAAADSNRPETRAETNAAGGKLFVQTASHGTFHRAKRADRGFVLRLHDVSLQVVWFTDRPARHAGQLSVTGFVASWTTFGFRADPPNAVLTLLHGDRNADTVALTLSHPHYDARHHTLRYTARKLSHATGSLSNYEAKADRRVPRSFKSASLFIDTADGSPVPTQTGTGSLFDVFAAGTPIALPDGGVVAIQDLMIGDQVMSVDAEGRPTTATVRFSECTPADATSPAMMYVDYGADDQVLIVRPDSVLPNGQLAGQLAPGDDLAGPNGESWRVNGVQEGEYVGQACGIKVDGTAWYIASGLLMDGRPVS